MAVRRGPVGGAFGNRKGKREGAAVFDELPAKALPPAPPLIRGAAPLLPYPREPKGVPWPVGRPNLANLSAGVDPYQEAVFNEAMRQADAKLARLEREMRAERMANVEIIRMGMRNNMIKEEIHEV